VRFTDRAFKDFELLERDPQLSGLMAFERTVQALFQQFIQRRLNRALGLFVFAFPKHTSLLRHGLFKTQVWLDFLPEPQLNPLESSPFGPVTLGRSATRFGAYSFVAAFEISGQFRQHKLLLEPLEISNAFQKAFGLIARNCFHRSSMILEQHRSVFQGTVRKRCALEFAVLVNPGLIIGHEKSLYSHKRQGIRHVAYVKKNPRLLDSRL
jgi:hypothetical protein